jgi:sulfate adenylyltransferase subunit 2
MSVLVEAQSVISRVREKSGAAILFCSWGKDSLVLLDMLAPCFDRLVCVFMYFVKGLEHIDRYAKWAKSRYPNIEVLEVPHWNLSHALRGGLYCPPNPKVKLMTLKDTEASVRLTTGIHYTFYGMKKADSLNRRVMLNGMEANGYESNGKVYPLASWTQKDVLAYMRHRKLPQPVRYSAKASGGVTLSLDCFLWLRENCPQDLERMLAAFLLSGRILYEYDQKQKAANL